jgi:adenylyl-sulfate kinase
MTRIFWFFGRSGAGKTTLATRLQQGLRDRGCPVFFIDGDEARGGLSSDLGFQPGARTEHHRRVAEVARLASRQGIVPIVATMAPEYEQRDVVQRTLGERLIWIFVDAPLDECLRRDPKGLYRRAKAGQVENLLEYPFDKPRSAECHLTIQTGGVEIDKSYRELVDAVMSRLED